MDTDEILEEIGSFGAFQKRNTLLLGLIIFVLTFQTVSMVFIGGEPTWRCSSNSTLCTRNGTISPDNDFYKARCNMSSEDWEFTTEFTSIVTEVGLSVVLYVRKLWSLRWNFTGDETRSGMYSLWLIKQPLILATLLTLDLTQALIFICSSRKEGSQRGFKGSRAPQA